MNWFVFSVGVIQVAGAIKYGIDGFYKFAILYFLYGLTNFVIFICKGE